MCWASGMSSGQAHKSNLAECALAAIYASRMVLNGGKREVKAIAKQPQQTVSRCSTIPPCRITHEVERACRKRMSRNKPTSTLIDEDVLNVQEGQDTGFSVCLFAHLNVKLHCWSWRVGGLHGNRHGRSRPLWDQISRRVFSGLYGVLSRRQGGGPGGGWGAPMFRPGTTYCTQGIPAANLGI